MGRSGSSRCGSGPTRGGGFGPRERDAPRGRPSRGARGPRSDCANDRARATGLRAIEAHHRSPVPREGVRGDRGGDRFTGAIRPGRFPVVRRVDRAGERGHPRPPATRGAGDGGRGSADGSPPVRAGDRAGAPYRGRLDGEGRRLATARAVPRRPRGVRSGPFPEAEPRAGPEMARDLCPAHGVGGERVMLAPDATERFLPSVDRLESAMHAARRAFERGDTDGALGQLGVALKLKPEYDAAWILKGHVLQKAGDREAALDAFMQSLKCSGDSKEGWMGLASALHELGRLKEEGEAVLWADRALRIREAPGLWYAKGLAHLGLLESTLAMRSFERALALDPTLKEAKAALGRATALRRKSDFYRGAYECFGTHLAGDPGCEECEIRPRCREVTP